MTSFYSTAVSRRALLLLVSVSILLIQNTAASEDEDDHGDHDGHDHDEHHVEHESSSHSDPWSEVIIATLLINMTTFVGVVVLTGNLCMNRLNSNKKSSEDQQEENITSKKKKKTSGWNFAENIIPSFAAGALLATCLFLMFPEAFFMISNYQLENYEEDEDAHEGHGHRYLDEEEEEGHGDEEGHEDHVDIDIPVAWRFAVSIMGGFLLPMVTSMLFSVHTDESPLEEDGDDDVPRIVVETPKGDMKKAETDSLNMLEDEKQNVDKLDDASSPGTLGEDCELAGCKNCDTIPAGTSPTCNIDEQEQVVIVVDDENKVLKQTSVINFSLAASILIGDFFHNFTDGVLVGTAFLLCNRELAIAISAATVYHEIAQELADYLLLTRTCCIRPGLALFLNFVSGLSVMIGAIMILLLEINSNATGCILAIGGGVYIFVAAVECIPRALQSHRGVFDKVMSVVSFVVGAVPIGLVLLNHGHCEAH